MTVHNSLSQDSEKRNSFIYLPVKFLNMKTVALLAGGDSGEYDISLKTADNIYKLLDRKLFLPYLIIVKRGEWIYTDTEGKGHIVDKNDFTLSLDSGKVIFDIAFIAIHGTPGENGKMQAYLEMLQIPYVACGMFCSAITFNKYFCNIAVSHFGIPVANSLHFYKGEVIDYIEVKRQCGYPCFVKPCNSGSSVGVTKVHSEEELDTAVDEAFRFDDQLMIEQFVAGREVTCGVAVIDGKPQALAVTEVKSSKEYYDYEAKYTPGFLELVTPADIDQELTQRIMSLSEKVFVALGCKGVVRIDYIVTENAEPFFLEINTIPGQTAMSIIPLQVKYRGMDIVDFYSDLLLNALN